MKHIKILGMGCPSCKKTESVIWEYLVKNGIEATIEKVEDLEQIVAYNVMTTPTVVVDEQIKIKGKVPTAVDLDLALA